MTKQNKIDVLFKKDKKKWIFQVHLINNSDTNFREINQRSHWSTSNDDEYIQTSTSNKQLWALKTWSRLLIDESDLNELDFLISYFLELIDEDWNLFNFWFSLPKHLFDDEVYGDWMIIESKEI